MIVIHHEGTKDTKNGRKLFDLNPQRFKILTSFVFFVSSW